MLDYIFYGTHFCRYALIIFLNVETLEMALLFWNYLFPETHVADQLDWK